MRILQVSSADTAGGAEAVAWRLFQFYRHRGHDSWLAVGSKHNEDHDVFVVPNNTHRNRWARTCLAIGDLFSPFVGKVRGAGWLGKFLGIRIGQPSRWFEIRQGKED